MDNNSKESHIGCSGCVSLTWWATLVVAVLAVPAFGIIVASLLHVKGTGEVVVFVLACWACTYLGMHLMKNPKMAEKFELPPKDKK